MGTVDQVLLAGLRVKWAHFRAASFSRSLLVVDEVHASDAYMTELLLGVLKGHLVLGGHALLMSATLGAAARSKFTNRAARFAPPAPRDAEDVPYPALTLVPADGLPETHAITTSGPTKSVSMSAVSILGDPDSIARTAAAAARDGAKVLVIRNTVSSAQAVFGALLAQGGGDVVLTIAKGPALHHSRFAAEDRRLLDDAVEGTIGKEASRSTGGLVVIGTQTLEQSLDIDADFLISDLCPVDVLLQRIGRLHRHARTSRPRPFGEPRCLVLVPEVGLEGGLGGALLQGDSRIALSPGGSRLAPRDTRWPAGRIDETARYSHRRDGRIPLCLDDRLDLVFRIAAQRVPSPVFGRQRAIVLQ